jgi:CheY-like chemotaxis protein
MSSDTTPSSLQDASKPLGLGLAVVARYVRNMKGQIRVKSELGKGTIFGIELPFEHASATPDRSPIRTSPSQMRLPRSLSNSSTNPPSRLPLLSQSKTTEDALFMFPGDEDSPSSGTEPSSRVESNDPQSPSMSSNSMEHFSSTFPFPKMESESSPSEPERLSLSVLIAEDNPINARLLTRRLQKLGHEVEVACDGQECHDHFAANPQKVDVILMDLQVCIPCLYRQLLMLIENRCH